MGFLLGNQSAANHQGLPSIDVALTLRAIDVVAHSCLCGSGFRCDSGRLPHAQYSKLVHGLAQPVHT